MTAFRQSVEAMIPALRRYARALARDADIADDLVQDTLVRALRSERLFLGGKCRGDAGSNLVGGLIIFESFSHRFVAVLLFL